MRAFVVRCHYYQEKVAILQKAAGKLLKTMDDDGIRIFPDYSLEVNPNPTDRSRTFDLALSTLLR